MNKLQLNELQLEALIELINISVGAAASVLSKMANCEIQLSVPLLDQRSRREVAELIESTVKSDIISINIDTEGYITGTSMLIFSEQSSLSLVRAILQDQVPLEMLSEMEEEALTEVGNVVLNACLATFSNLLNEPLTTSVPCCVKGPVSELIGLDETRVLFIRVDFTHQHGEEQGFITLMFDVHSMNNIVTMVDKYLQQISSA